MRRLLTPTLVVFFAVVAVVVYFQLQTGAKFLVKRVCSAHFVGNYELDKLEKDGEFSVPAFRWLPLSWTVESDRVDMFAFFGLFPIATARFCPLQGCVVEQDSQPIKCLDCFSAKRPAPETSSWPSDKLRLDSNVQKILARRMSAQVNDAAVNARALLVVHSGVLVGELYREPKFSSSQRYHGWSVTKSLLPLIVGNLVLTKTMKMPQEEPVRFPPNGSIEYPQLRLQHLLDMQSGLEWEEEYTPRGDPTIMLTSARDMAGFGGVRRLVHEPGTFYRYSSYDSNLLSYNLRAHFPNVCAYHRAVQEVLGACDADDFFIESDESGTLVMSSYGWASARSWAKVASVFANDGVSVSGNRILPVGWAAFQSSLRSNVSVSNGVKLKPYSGGFWLSANHAYKNLKASDAYFMQGFEYQNVAVIPSKQLVVVQFGCTRADKGIPPFVEQSTEEFLNELIDELEKKK